MEPVRAEELLSPPNDGSVANLVARAVREFPDRLAVEHDGRGRTYAELDERVRAISDGLADVAEPGDRVGLYLPNGVAFAEALLACVHAGVVATPLNPQYRRREIAYQLDHSDAVALVTDGPGEEHVVPVAREQGVEVISADPESEHVTLEELAAGGGDRLVERGDEDVLLQPYTSGTTGNPKGVLLTHRNFRVQIVNSVVAYTGGPIEGDSLIVLPMYHITGLLGLIAGLSAGRTVRMLRPDEWDPGLVLRKLDEHDVPSFTGVAAMFTDLLEAYEANPREYDLDSLWRAGQGGDKLSRTVHERFEEILDVPVYEGYGLTETTATTHTVRASTLGDKLGSVGQPIGHTDSKVVDRDGEQVAPGEEGEILVRGPQVMEGYYDDPEATDEAFTDDGYFRTGDRGSLDADNYYYVHGREKEMILTAGYNVYPAEVEEVLYDHPSVGEATVFALPHERRGETVAAAVTPAAGADEPDPETLKEYVLAELAPYKHPRTVLVLPELPRTGSGKVQKRRLRELAEGKESDGAEN
ncbi:class I adenylate-forming enzyme family protein [Salinirubellus sp. GCM10025818]|uniref:class I adenylate-forming enzyme family protein n=1 Tax=Salinirubellus TaxID=2162630 RepID=UPI0030CB223A